MHHPGVEPGSRAWKAHILTVGLMERVASDDCKIYVIFLFPCISRV